jgi:hypothetical protein
MRYGNITVFSENVDDTAAPDFVIRTFKVENETGETRKLTHFQYLSWPDHGVPESPTRFMTMLKTVREMVDVSKAPMVVHCSAGCGRTGTLACIDDVWTALEVSCHDTHRAQFPIPYDLGRPLLLVRMCPRAHPIRWVRLHPLFSAACCRQSLIFLHWWTNFERADRPSCRQTTNIS